MFWVILLFVALLGAAIWWLRREPPEAPAREPTLFGKETTLFADDDKKK